MTGLFDWFFSPPQGGADGGDRGYNNLGLIGATLKDVGASLNGESGSALESFGRSRLIKQGNRWYRIRPGGPPEPVFAPGNVQPASMDSGRNYSAPEENGGWYDPY